MVACVNLAAAVTERINNSGEAIKNAVVDRLVQEEVNKRVELVLKVLGKREELAKKYDGVKPENQFFDGEGKPVGEAVFTKPKLDERNKYKTQIEQLDKAMDAAFGEKPNWEPLKKCVGSDQQPAKKDPGGEEKKAC